MSDEFEDMVYKRYKVSKANIEVSLKDLGQKADQMLTDF